MNHYQPDPVLLIDAILDGTCTPTQAEELQRALRDDPAAVSAYLDQVRVHALLQWRHGHATARVPTIEAPAAAVEQPIRLADHPLRRALHLWRPWAAAAALLLGLTLAVSLSIRHWRAGSPRITAASPVAEVTEVRDVVWASDERALAVGSRVAPGRIAIRSGTLRFRSDAGAVVTMTGAAQLRVVSGMRVQAIDGRITVRVSERAHGFTVETPGADVVDLGTEFGVHVADGGQTDVVVFEGNVDVSRKAPATHPATPASQPAPTRVAKGEGLHIDSTGRVSRIVTITHRPGEAEWTIGGPAGADDASAVISSVRDNRRDPGANKYYQIVRHGLAEDVPAYVDRAYEWNGVDDGGLAPELRGADLVMTFNSDKREPDLQLTVTLDRPAALYIFHEPRHGVIPEWLSRDFRDTGLTIGLDEGPPDMPHKKLGKGAGQSIDRVFQVWRRDVTKPGAVTLGENSPESKVMYGIAAAPLK